MAEFSYCEKMEKIVVQDMPEMFSIPLNPDGMYRSSYSCDFNVIHNPKQQQEASSKSRKMSDIEQTIDDINSSYKVLVLMRGLPGSGKSTLAKSILHSTIGYNEVIANNHIFSTDDYFMKLGKYQFDPKKVGEAHGWNHQRANRAMSQGFSPVIIDNTNTAMWEMKPYVHMSIDYGYILRIVEPNTHWCFHATELAKRNTHNVPKQTINAMLERFQRNVTPSKLFLAYDCKYTLQKPPQFRKHPAPSSIRSRSQARAAPALAKTQQSSVDDILIQNGDTSFLKTPVLKPVQQSLSLFDNINAWGIDEKAIRSWDIVTPLECIEPQVIVVDSDEEVAVVEVRMVATETCEEDFQMLRQAEGGDAMTSVTILATHNRDINPNYRPNYKPRGIAKKLMIDAGNNTDECHEDNLESLRRVFPNVSPKAVEYWYRKCSQDFNWTMELLLAERAETINVIIEDSDMESLQPRPCARAPVPETSDSSSDNEPKGATKKKLQKRKSRCSSDELRALKKEIESKVTIADVHYSDYLLRVKQRRFGRSKTSEEMDSDTDNMEVPSPPSPDTIELNLGNQLVKQLEECFGDKNLLYPKGFQPVVQMPVDLARQLFTFYIESVYQQMDAQKVIIEELVCEDEEFAQKLQAAEEAVEAARPDPSELPDIMREQRELSKLQKEAEKWKNETPDTLAAKLTNQKLFQLFPTVDRDTLREILHAHDNVYKDTVETLIASTGINDQLDLDEAIRPPIEPEVMREMWDAHDICNQEKLRPEVPCTSATGFRDKANQCLQKRTELYEKANRHYQNGLHEVARFYSGLASEQTQLYNQANSLAATAFLDEHSRRLENFNTLDLHFLYVKEAIPQLDIYLDRMINLARASTGKHSETIQIITGRGKNSVNGVAKIRPAVITRLKQRKLWYMQLNPGLLKAKVGRNSRLTSEL